VLEALVKAGALDSLAPPVAAGSATLPPRVLRPRLMAALDAAVDHGARVQRDQEFGQGALFGGGADDHETHGIAALPEAPAWSDIELLNAEKDAVGLYWTGHPIDAHAADLREFGARTIADLQGEREEGASDETASSPATSTRAGEDVMVGGIVSGCRPLKTRKGDPMAVFTLEDPDGSLEVVAFPETFKLARTLIEDGTLVLVKGKLERDDETLRILASEVLALGVVRERLAHELAITVNVPPHGRETFEALAEVFSRHKGDKPVTFQLLLKGQPTALRVRAQVSAHIRVRPSPVLVEQVERICGPGAVSLR
jgi:DNA polymerase-3 subunit alpha